MHTTTFIRQLMSRLGATVWHAARPRPRARYRPEMDSLEDRCLLSGGVIEYQTPTPLGGPCSLAVGQDGSIWFTEYFGGTIGRFFPAEERFVRYTIPTLNSYPFSITRGSDGNFWFTEQSANKLGKITPAGVVEREYPLPLPNCSPTDLVAGPDGRLWFTAPQCQRIMALTPSTGRIDAYFLAADSAPIGITGGPDGNLWFADNGRNAVGAITVGGVILPEVVLLPVGTPPVGPYDVATGSNGNVWYTRFTLGPPVDRVGTITPDRRFVRELVTRPGCNPHSIAARQDNTMWVACFGTSSVLRLSHDGFTLGEFAIPTSGVQPNAIAVDQDSNIWVSELLPSRIGKIREFPILAEGTYLTGTVGQSVAGVVATFRDADPAPHPVSFYTAWIYWGDGAVTAGQIEAIGPSTFMVSGNHVYGAEGLYPIAVYIWDHSPFYTPALAISFAEITQGGLAPGGGSGWQGHSDWIDLDVLLKPPSREWFLRR